MRTAIVLSAALLTACAGLPQREPQPQLKASAQYASEQSFADAAGEWPTDAWWRNYGDSQLDALVDEGLAGSPTLAAADARVRRAQAFAASTRAIGLPQLSMSNNFTDQKQSYNYLSPAPLTPQGWNDYGRSTLDLSWELDFWGKNRKALAAATSDAAAARADAAQARLTLASAIAASYAELARQYATLDSAVAAREVRAKTVELFQNRRNNGLETLGSVRQVEARRAAAEADVLSIQEQIALQRNRLAALLGEGPDRGLSIARPSLNLTCPCALPEQLAANLIGRRPDLSAARLRAQAAQKRVGQAQAAFYPNVNLGALIGVQARGIDMLRESGSDIGSLGSAISLPIFTGGRLRAQLRSADAEYAESVASYEKALAQALQEVADAVVSRRSLAPQIASINEAVEAALDARRVQNDRYEGGLATYLDVLSAEDYLLSNLRVQADLQSRAFALDVALQRALGGGYIDNSIHALAHWLHMLELSEGISMTKMEQEVFDAAQAAVADSEDRRKQQQRKKMLLALAMAAIASGGGYWSYSHFYASQFVATDNAYTAAEMAQVTPALGGVVSEVRVTDTQAVRKGDVVVVLDDTDARLALAQAEAELGRAERRVRGYVANDKSLSAQIASRLSEQRRMAAQLAAANADFERARIDLDRREALVASGSVSGDELTKARNAYESAQANVAAAQAAAAQSKANHIAAIGSREANAVLIADTSEAANPEVALARARRDQAQVNLERTIIRAPVDGVVAKRQVQVGQQIQAGMPVLSVVPLAQVHVDANFKEVQLERVQVGQPVQITSDLYGTSVKYHGVVAGLAGGTGATFATIPAQNATGNWIKVVQRVPVRIQLDAKELAARPLQVGLSMQARIDTRG